MRKIYHLSQSSKLFCITLLSVLLMNCSEYQKDKARSIMGGVRGWDVAGRTELSSTVTEIKLPDGLRFRGYGQVEIYLETAESAVVDNDELKKKCLQRFQLGIICLRDGKAIELSGSLVKATGEVQELTSADGRNGLALLQFAPEYNLANDGKWKEFSTLRLRTSEILIIDHIIIWDDWKEQ